MAVSLFLALIGCQGNPSQTSADVLKDQDLVVTESPVSYKKTEAAYLTSQMVTIYTRSAQILYKTTLTEEEKNSASEYITQNILPMLQAVGVTKDELTQLFYFTQFLLNTAEKSSAIVAKKLLEQTYQNCIQVLGSKRAGKVFYHSCILYLEYKIAQNGENTEALRVQLTELRDVLGVDAFTDAATAFYFATSLFSNNTPQNDASSQFPALTNEELLLLWQRQAEQMTDLTLTNEQWEVAGEFFFRLLFRVGKSPFEKDSLKSALWQTMKNAGAGPVGIGSAVPDFIKLYSALIQNMTTDHVEQLRTGDAIQKQQCILSLLRTCPAELECFLASFSDNVRLETEVEKQLLTDKQLWQVYLAYRQERKTVSAKALCDILCKDNPSTNEWSTALENYLFGNMPYAIFVFFYERSLTQ